MLVSDALKNQHLLWRSAFGPIAGNANDLSTTTPKNLYSLLVKTSSKNPHTFNVASNLFDGLLKGVNNVLQLEDLSKEQKQAIRKQSREDLKSLNMEWLNEMINSEAQLREKASLFWHGHFALPGNQYLFSATITGYHQGKRAGKFW